MNLSVDTKIKGANLISYDNCWSYHMTREEAKQKKKAQARLEAIQIMGKFNRTGINKKLLEPF